MSIKTRETLKGINSKQVVEQFPEQVESKKAFIFGIAPSKNDDYFIVGSVQYVPKDNTTMSMQARIAAKNNDWSTLSPNMHYSPVKKKVAEELGMEEGKFLSDVYGETVNVRKKLTLRKRSWESGESSPVSNLTTGEIMLFEGYPYYQDTFLDEETPTLDVRTQDLQELLLLEATANKVELVGEKF